MEYAARLDARKRAVTHAQAATPMAAVAGGNKARKLTHGMGPSSSPAPAAAAAAHTAVPFTLPLSSPFTSGRTALHASTTPAVSKRTRASLNKASERKPITHTGKPSAVKQHMQSKSIVKKAAPSGKAPEQRTLFTSKIPVRPLPAAASAITAAVPSTLPSPAAGPFFPSTTFTSIACIEDIQSARASVKPAVCKFDLSASLAKPLTWKPHKGKMHVEAKAGKQPSKQQAAAMEDKENAMTDVSESTSTPAAFVFDASTAVFTAGPPVPTTTGLSVQKQPKAVVRGAIKDNKPFADRE